MDSEKDTLKKIDEDIEFLLSENETLPEKKLETTTKIFDQKEQDKIEANTVFDTKEVTLSSTTKINKISSKIEQPTSPKEEKIEEKIEEKSTDIPVDDVIESEKPKSNKKYWLIFIFIIFIIIAFIVVFFVVTNKKEDNTVVPIDNELISKREQKIIINYGQMLEKVISDEYNASNVLLSYEEANKKIKLENTVLCSEVEIYSDCTVYLNSCSINGKKTKYNYGQKKEKEIPVSSDQQIVIYENKLDKGLTMTKPDSIENYQYYIVSVTPGYHDVTFIGNQYLFYVDSNVIGNLVDFRTNKKALSQIDYSDVALIRLQDQQFDSNVVAMLINQKWNFFNLETSRRTHYSTYDAIGISLTNDTSGKSPYVETIRNNYMVVSTNNFTLSGVINYVTGDEIIPILYRRLASIDDFVLAYKNDFIDVYTYDGKRELIFYNIYSVLSNDVVLAVKDQELFVIDLHGHEHCKYDTFHSTYEFSRGIMENDTALFEFLDNKKKVQYTYDPSSEKCIMKEK